MRVIVVRGATGVVVWIKGSSQRNAYHYTCSRDLFVLQVPIATNGLEQFLLQLAQHSTGLVGAIQQIVQLEI